ncbi:hypothetical protein MB14_09160 [Roseivirga ehrenbergii]|uniref:Uncharacterized protein n=1 Tax=Roseivirga ehrenbergii (strain DSM 102268 / JCM 13514 / KCTC 12282 / NCIMB 14502 / KMM 6017) TaxID=279360 RepID=A0A150X0C6_ROSEK|nr:hypothetical protein MB14_09160 [Roseivirga ehrenbergii]
MLKLKFQTIQALNQRIKNHLPPSLSKLIGFSFVAALSLLSIKINAQTKITKNSENRFIGMIKSDFYSDPNGLLKDASIGIEWWTLLGEPVELYSVKWNSTGVFKVNIEGKQISISKNSLNKYPDLQKRFDNIKPYKIDFAIYGTADGGSSSVKRGSSFQYSSFYNQGSAYKKDGQSYDPYKLSARVLYQIPDAKLLVGKSGQTSRSIVPESPMTWNEFIAWKQNTSNYSEPNIKYDYLVLNKSESEYRKLDEGAKKQLISTLKHLYSNTNSFTLKAQITNLEWPKYELESLAREFLKREEKKETEEEQKEDDFWSGEEEKTDKTKEAKEDDFWNGKSENTQENTDDFWSGKDKSKNTEDDFWGGKGSVEEEVELERKLAEASGDQYLGHKTVTTKYIRVRCRDHGDIDGDRVEILHNGKVIESNYTLSASFSTFNVELTEGINRISFRALNQGSLGNNTAQFRIEDQNDNLLYNNEWNITTGYKGTLLIIKN